MELGVLQVGRSKAGSGEAGPLEVGPDEFGPVEVRLAEVGFDEKRALCVRKAKVCASQLSSLHQRNLRVGIFLPLCPILRLGRNICANQVRPESRWEQRAHQTALDPESRAVEVKLVVRSRGSAGNPKQGCEGGNDGDDRRSALPGSRIVPRLPPDEWHSGLSPKSRSGEMMQPDRGGDCYDDQDDVECGNSELVAK